MKLTKQNVPFTMVANAVLERADLSLKAKGLFSYLFSKPDGWEFAAERIASQCQEERKAIQRILKELEDAGLLKRSRLPSGKMEYRISFSEAEQPVNVVSMFPLAEQAVKTGLVGPLLGIVPDLSPIDGGKTINDLIDLFKPLNPSHDRLFANKSQRAAMQRLLMKYGESKVRNMLAAAQTCFGKEYCPTITTPVQLEAKLGALVSAVHKMKSKGPGVVSL